MKILLAWLCCLICVLMCIDAIGDENDQSKKKKSYSSAAADCDKAIAAKNSSLAESYSSEVWGLKQRFQQDGNLENALAADKEWSRSIRREPLTSEDLVESPKELRVLQDAYVGRYEQVKKQVAADFVRGLESEAKELARAGNLTDGRVLQQEIDKINRLYLSDKQLDAVKAARDDRSQSDPVAACEEAIRQNRSAIQAQYVGELEAMEKSFQAEGALEDLFAAKAEKQRFMETPTLVESTFVEKPEELRNLQQKYCDLQGGLAAKTAEEFIVRLEQQKQSLTIEGRLDEAIKAKSDAEKISARFLKVRKPIDPKSPEKLIVGRWACKHLGATAEYVLRFSANGDLFVYATPDTSNSKLAGRWKMEDGLPMVQYSDGNWDKITNITDNEIQYRNRDGTRFTGRKLK